MAVSKVTKMTNSVTMTRIPTRCPTGCLILTRGSSDADSNLRPLIASEIKIDTDYNTDVVTWPSTKIRTKPTIVN